MPGIYFIITIIVGITLYLVLSLIWKQEQDKQKYDEILEEMDQDLIKKYERKAPSLHPKPLPNADPDYSSQTEMLG